jgi:hypothetical protein
MIVNRCRDRRRAVVERQSPASERMRRMSRFSRQKKPL